MPAVGAEPRVVYVTRVLSAAGAEVAAVLEAGTPTHERLRDTLVVVAIATVGMDVVCAVLALLFERHGPGTDITSFGSALFWTSTQLLTVSSSVENPVSTAGRVLDVIMEGYAITVVSTLAGSIGAFAVKRGRELENYTD